MKKSDTEQEQPGLEENKVPDSQSKRELDRELQELAEKEHQEEIYYEERRRERHERNLKRKKRQIRNRNLALIITALAVLGGVGYFYREQTGLKDGMETLVAKVRDLVPDKNSGKESKAAEELAKADQSTENLESTEPPESTEKPDINTEEAADSSDSTDSSEKDSTASESDSESVDSTDDKASAENSSTDSSDSTDASDDSSSSEDTKTTTVDKQLVIYVGDEASDGSRYVTVDNKHIYTMSADTLSAVIDKAPSDLWSLIVNYLSVKNLDQLQVTYGGATNTVNVSRETSKDDDGNDKETTTYQLDGKEIESTTFTTFYNKLINMAGQKRLTDAYTPATDPEMTAVFTDSDKNQTTVTFYTYDTNYYAAVVGNKVFLVNKMTVKEMFNAYETLINGESKTEATATPTAEAEK